MEWYRATILLTMFFSTGLFAEARKPSTPAIRDTKQRAIEVTLPTSMNPLPSIPMDSKGKPVTNRNFPPIAVPEEVQSAATNTKTQAEQTATSTDSGKQAVAETTDTATNNLLLPITQTQTPPTPAPAETGPKPSLPAAAEAAVILSRNQFYPQRVLVPQGTRVRIWFTTVEAKPAALIVEGLQMQRWIASENPSLTSGNAPGYFELQRELTRERVTEITLQPSAGTYPFFDALSGARGEIVVE